MGHTPPYLVRFSGKLLRIEERVVDLPDSKQEVLFKVTLRSLGGDRCEVLRRAPFEDMVPGESYEVVLRQPTGSTPKDPADDRDDE